MGGSPVESPLHRAPDGLKLIETAHWDGATCRFLDRHLARLADGARRLGWHLPVLRGAFTGPAGRAARLRLLIGADGVASVETAPLPAPVARWHVGLSGERLRSDDPWLRIKSTHRPAYGAARRALPEGLDEVLLLNERGEVCDGSITTVFFDRGAGMRTPPLASGVLPGVLRSEMIARGVREEVLVPHDLPLVRLWLGNALRGMGEAVFVPR
ncbi:aminotransferase class IV [Sinirhodobacter populi]|uniref:Probable branched-chain-amino-acid aminotransferase n=1 Tax=Paenirhodobacter populi TaxID=2306993 RepID=A0A443KH34_9RHOB|nr:aminotransferase class IV [Sinirhodobacter populi]